jgi:hypothetical protein
MTGEPGETAAAVMRLRETVEHAVGLPKSDVESITVLIDAGEWRVALEALCTQIYEYDLEVNDAQRSVLNALGKFFAVPVGHLLGDP